MALDILSYLLGRKSAGGGESVDIEPLAVTVNGEYTPESGKAFGTVTVNVGTSAETDMTNATFTDANTDGNVVIT